VRTDPNAPKHKGISVLLIPTDSPGLTRRPFASAAGRDDLDFNEVFFTDVRVPVENLVGPLNEGWRVANGSLGHERTMLWMSYADQLQQITADFEPLGELERDRYAALVMDYEALRLLGSVTLARASRGEEDVAGQSVLKLLGSEAVQTATEHVLGAGRADGLVHPARTSRYAPLNLDSHYGSWFDRYLRTFAATIAGGTSEIQRNIIAQRILGLPRN
jgi:alkylation response protein AidB-like acyl-CoA dehydrogenase